MNNIVNGNIAAAFYKGNTLIAFDITYNTIISGRNEYFCDLNQDTKEADSVKLFIPNDLDGMKPLDTVKQFDFSNITLP